MNDIEGWGAPERLGLRREPRSRTVLARRCVAVVLIGAIVLGLGTLGAFPSPL